GQGVHVGDGVVVVNPPADDLSPGRLLAVAVDGQQRPISLNPGAELIAVGSGGESWLAIGPGDTMTAVDGERILQIPIEIVAAAWSADGESLVVAGSSGELAVIDIAIGEVVGTTNADVGGALWNLRVHAGAGRE
ncbi:MAG: hypothetical protein KJO18_09205, partial [Acidimicrobiia bacterium]|nr:hypothetical protein [Acidimicrobiia bacterium]